MARSKINPITIDQRLEISTVSNDVIVIDDMDEQNDKKTTQQQSNSISAETQSNEFHVDSHTPSNDSGCVIANREEVGIHCNINYEMSTKNSDVNNHDVQPDCENRLNRQTPISTSDGRNNTINSQNEIFMECEALNMTNVSDVNQQLTTANTSTGSISSYSELATEQLLIDTTTATNNQKFCDRIASDVIEKEPLTRDSCTQLSTTMEDSFEINNTNLDSISSSSSVVILTLPTNLSTVRAKNNEKPNQQHLQTTKKQQETNFSNSYNNNNNNNHNIRDLGGNHNVTVDKTIGETDNNENITFESVDESRKYLLDANGTKMVRSQTKNRTNGAKVASVKVVHPTRHNQWTNDDINDAPEQMRYQASAAIPKEFECSISLSSIKTNSLFFKNTTEHGNKRTDQLQDSEHNTITTNVNTIPDQGNANETSSIRNKISLDSKLSKKAFDGYDNNLISPRQRMIAKPTIDDESIPSTIMERKTYIKPKHTYIKPATVGLKNNKTGHTQSTLSSSSTTSSLLQSQNQTTTDTNSSPSKQYTNSTQTQTQQQQPYKVFYSGTDIDLGINDVVDQLSECVTSGTNPIQLLTPSAFCESDNSLVNPSLKPFVPSTSSSLPSAIVHPLGLENTTKYISAKASANIAAKIMEKQLQLDATATATSHPSFLSSDERSSIEDPIDSCDNLTTISSNSEDVGEMEYKPEYMLQIYKELGDHLKTMGYKPENEIKRTTKAKRLMNAASKFLDADDTDSVKYSPDLNEENDEGDASLPFKKRRKLPVFSDSMQNIKEEDSDSQPPFEFPTNIQCEVEITSTSLSSPPPISNNMTGNPNVNAVEENQNQNQNQPITHMECVSYPPTPMLSEYSYDFFCESF